LRSEVRPGILGE